MQSLGFQLGESKSKHTFPGLGIKLKQHLRDIYKQVIQISEVTWIIEIDLIERSHYIKKAVKHL